VGCKNGFKLQVSHQTEVVGVHEASKCMVAQLFARSYTAATAKVLQASVQPHLAIRCWRIAVSVPVTCDVFFQQVDQELTPVVSTCCAIKESACSTDTKSCTYIAFLAVQQITGGSMNSSSTTYL
jgi:hypothetical protein